MKNVNKRNTILLSAVKIFAKEGFEKATIDEIIKDAGVAKGTVYYYFKSKEEIFNAIISDGIIDFENKIKEAILEKENIIDKIESFIDTEKKYILKYSDFFTVFVSELIKKSKRFYELEKLIDEGKLQNIIKKELDTEFVSSAIFWTVAMTTIDGQVKFQKELFLKGILE